MEQVDVYATVIGGGDTAQAVDRSAAKLGFESSRTRPPEEHSIEFVDYPFSRDNPSFDDHLATVREERHRFDVVESVNHAEDRAVSAIREASTDQKVAITDGGQDKDMSDDSDLYDPTQEYDEIEESGGVSAIGDGRRKTLDALDQKDTLDDPVSFGSLDEMKNALREISLAHPDGRLKVSPPEDAISAVEAAYSGLPDEAQDEYLNDHRLYVKIRAARNRFNDWMSAQRRRDKIPSTMEAGRSNYPADKANRTAERAREARDELDEALGKVRSAARGAKQRALEAIGSSVAEQNEKKAEKKRDSMKDRLEPGSIVFNRDTRYGLVPWGVKRLNKKSVRLKRPHQSAGMEKPYNEGTYPEYDLTTVDYDKSYLTPIPRDELDDLDPDEIDGDVPDELTDGYESAIRYLMGDDWVDDNLGDDLRAEDPTAPEPDDDTGFSDDEIATIKEAVRDGNFSTLIKTIHSDQILITNDWEFAGIESARDVVDHYDDRGNFEVVKGVGPATSEKIEPAVPHIREALDESESDSTSESMSENDTYDPTDEWVDDTAAQDTLVDDDARVAAERETESRPDQGGSEQFLDDRADTDDDEPDTGEQASPFTEEVDDGGQIDLSGSTATDDPAWMEEADDGTDYPENVGPYWGKTVDEAGTVAYWSNGVEAEYISQENQATFSGDNSSETLSFDTSAAFLDYLKETDPADIRDRLNDSSDGPNYPDGFGKAVAYVREFYGDGVQGRHELASDLKDFAKERDRPITRAADEGTMQSLIRYQHIPPQDVMAQMQNRMSDDEAEETAEMLADFAEAGASRHDGRRGDRPAWHQKWTDEVTGIGGTTESNLREIGISDLGDVVDAYDGMHDSATWDDVVDTLPTGEARDNLLEAIDEDRKDADEYQGDFKNKHMENAHYWAGQAQGWMQDETTMQDGWYVEIKGGKPIVVLDKPRFTESTVGAVKDGLRDANFPHPKRVKELDDHFRIFISEPSDDRLVSNYQNDWREFENPLDKFDSPDYMDDDDDVKQTGAAAAEGITDVATGQADDGPEMMTLEVEGSEYEVPRAANGWTWTQPADDPAQATGPGHGNTTRARWERGDDVLALRGRGTNYRLFYWPNGDTNQRVSAGIGAVTFGEELRRAKDYIVDGEELPEPARPADDSSDIYDPVEEWGPTASRPVSDVEDDLTSPQEAALLDEPDPTPSTDSIDAEEEAKASGVTPETLYDAYAEGERTKPLTLELPVDGPGRDTVTDALGTLRRDYRSIRNDQAEGYKYDFSREDISHLIKRFNVEMYPMQLDQDELTILWAATTRFAESNGNTRGLNALEKALVDAEDTDADPVEDDDDVKQTGAAAAESITDVATGQADDQDSSSEAAEKVEFGTLDAANEWRDDWPAQLHPDDKRTTKTVKILGSAPEKALEEAGTKATISGKQSKSYGHAELTDEERDRLEDRDGWTWGNKGFHATATKAILQEEGGTPWLDYYDPTIEPSEHISVIESGEQMALAEGMSGPGETGMRDDSSKSQEQLAQDLDKGRGEMCSRAESACEDGEEEACRQLLEDCNYSEDEIERIMETTRGIGEEPAEVYDPTEEQDTGQSFDEWAREAEPSMPETPERPDEETLRELAPSQGPEELSPQALRAVKKAWGGYKAARAEAREAHRDAEHYAEIINGVRAVHGQDPLDFEEIEEWDGGQVAPEPGEEFPGPDGDETTVQEAAQEGRVTGTVQATFDALGDTYDPTENF